MEFQIIDLNTIKQSMMGNDALIKELVNMYIMQSPADFRSLEDAINSGDKSLIRKKAHHIKPTMQYIGANELMDDFHTLESLAKTDATQDEIVYTFEKIKPKFHHMVEELEFLSKKGL